MVAGEASTNMTMVSSGIEAFHSCTRPPPCPLQCRADLLACSELFRLLPSNRRIADCVVPRSDDCVLVASPYEYEADERETAFLRAPAYEFNEFQLLPKQARHPPESPKGTGKNKTPQIQGSRPAVKLRRAVDLWAKR